MKLKFLHLKLTVILLFLVCGNDLMAQTQDLIVIDKDYKQKEKLLTLLPASVSIIHLDGRSNPWKVIRETLEQNKSIKNIHLFAESASNSITMGGIKYTEESIQAEGELSMLEGLYFGIHYQFLIYTCNLPATPEGLELIKKIGEVTYFNIAVSTTCKDVFNQLTFDFTSLNQPTVAPIIN